MVSLIPSLRWRALSYHINGDAPVALFGNLWLPSMYPRDVPYEAVVSRPIGRCHMGDNPVTWQAESMPPWSIYSHFANKERQIIIGIKLWPHNCADILLTETTDASHSPMSSQIFGGMWMWGSWGDISFFLSFPRFPFLPYCFSEFCSNFNGRGWTRWSV